MTKILSWIGKHAPLLFAGLGTILVLWQMLLPGYVLTWDMVFGPSHVFPDLSGLINSLPYRLLAYAAGFVVPMWFFQKIILFSLFFFLFYLPIRFFPFQTSTWARYAAATLYAVNPFVYERFLAGQWAVLCAYALLAPFFYFLLNLVRGERLQNAIYVAITILLIGIFSLHAFVMAVLVAATVIFYAILRFVFQRDVREIMGMARRTLFFAFLVIVGSLYWTLPYLLNTNSSIAVFTAEHWEAFKTSIDPLVFGNATGNVAMLYGFWGESYPWMQSLLSPKDAPLVFVPALLAIFGVIITGAVSLFRQNAMRWDLIALLTIAVAAFIFSVGLADSVFYGFNRWLFEHVPFWPGFRDTEKWSMWLALVYSYLFGAGAAVIASKVWPKISRPLSFIFILLPFIYTFTMLGGFAGQVKPVDYPVTWYKANEIISKTENCKALFLPWHQYYWLAFNNGMLTANPASRFFDCKIISSKDAEIGNVGDQGNTDASYQAIARVVTSNDPAGNEETLSTFREEGIQYIIVTNDLVGLDPYSYPFLTSPGLEKLYTGGVDNLHLELIKL